MANKNKTIMFLVLAGFLFLASEALAIPPGAVPPSALPGSGSAGTAYASVGCDPGYAYPKASPGLGNGPCATNRCMPNGHLNVAVCVPETVCAGMRGSPIKNSIGQLEGWGCDTSKDVCCVTKKNRCNDSSTDMNKVYVCATASQCTTGAGGTIYSGGPSGCNDKGAYPICCELKDSVTDPQPSVGEPFIPLPAGTTGAGGGFDVKRRKFVDINAFCHTESECVKASGVGNWVSGQGCPKKGNTVQGYCMSPDPDYELQYPIGGVTTINGLKNFIGLIFNYGMGVIIIAAALLFMYGGFRYMFSAVANDIQTAKTIMIDSLAGLALGLSAYAILANVNVNTTILRSYKVPMINRISFIDVLYCRDVNPAEGKSEVLLQDAGPPDNPINFDVKKGFTKSLKEAECGREYFVEGGDSLSVCKGETCSNPNQMCMSCASGELQECISNSRHEMRCVDKTKFQITGNINSRLEVSEVQLYMICLKQAGSGYEVIDDEDMGETAPVSASATGSGASTGFMGGYVINRILAGDVKKFDEGCKADGGQARGVLSVRVPDLSLAWGLYPSDGQVLVSKSLCGKDLFSLASILEEIIYSPGSFNCVGGSRDYLTTFSSAIETYSGSRPGDFKRNYLDGAWTAEEIINAANHTKIISCGFNFIGEVDIDGIKRNFAFFACSNFRTAPPSP